MKPLPTLGTTVALLCSVGALLMAERWPGTPRALTAQRQLSAGALEGIVRWMGGGVC